ncbi:MAG: hypothetical protein ACE5D1_09730, partial [Fidelibacterota bacterium]
MERTSCFRFANSRRSAALSGLTLGFSLFFIIGCQPVPTLPQPGPDDRYDTEILTEGIGALLDSTSKSLVRLNYIGTYAIHTVPPGTLLTRNQRTEFIRFFREPTDEYENQTSSGTGILLKSTKDFIQVLTCAHIGNYPDTVYAYRSAAEQEQDGPLDAIALKIKEKYYTSDLEGVAELIPVKTDFDHDLMLLEGYRES